MILAKKTPQGREPVTLLQHTQDVCDAAEALFGTVVDPTRVDPTRLGEQWIRFFQLDPAPDYVRFANNLLASCLFHDWGKANSGMQTVLNGKKGGQLMRHEHLSVLLLGCQGVDQWVRQREDIDWDIVLAAVGSHHLKFGDTTFAEEGSGSPIRMLMDDPQFCEELLPSIAKRLRLIGSPQFPLEKYWGFTSDSVTFDISELRDALKNGRLRQITVTCRDSAQPKARMLNAVRSALIAADAAGSGLRRTELNVKRWVSGQFDHSKLCDGPFVDSMIQSRVDDLTQRGKWEKWNDFQIACDTLPKRSLLLAPCGVGKTLAAWRWIAAQVKQRATKRILFLYPTRATATEGFKDYVSWAPEAAAALMHGTAGYDLDEMFPVEDPRTGKVFNDTDPRLFALQHWSKRVFSATVDQFFAFLSYGYGPLCLLPLLADSVIVVDEVHSFDRSMFSALLGFLKTFDVPVLCMTATLLEPRQRDLVDVGLHLMNAKPEDLRGIADAPRYQVSRIQEGEAEQKARKAVAEGKRVLWVVNQVSRAQAIATRLQGIAAPLVCYHSRFKLDDRVNRHRDMMNAIKAGQPAAVGIGTQVCEMSLDIDADILITEECLISSLVQRLGRCRRGRDELATKGPGEVFVYKPAEEKVYSQQDLVGLSDFLDFVSNKSPVSQSDLEVGLAKFGPKTAEAPKLNSFLSSGAYALGGEDSFRDIEAFNVPAILSNEITAYLAATNDEKPGFIVPVPRKLKPANAPRLPRFLYVADERHYDPNTGFWDTPIR